MKYLNIILLQTGLFLFQSLTLIAQEKNNQQNVLSISKVGMISRTYTDKNRTNWKGTGRKKINTVIWYPTNDSTIQETLIGPFVKVPIVENGEISAKSSKYPLIIFSHGAGGEATQLIAWGHYLAARGYIVASVNHKTDPTPDEEIGSFSLSDRQMWQRPQDLTSVLNKIIDDTIFGSVIDKNKIAAGGFSLGGYTVIALAGARLDLQQLMVKSGIDSLPDDIRKSIELYGELLKKDPILQESLKSSGNSFKDKRVKGVFALAPAIGEGFTKTGLREVKVPVFIVVGEHDLITPKEQNAQLYAEGIKGAKLTVLPGEVGHITQPSPIADQNWIKVFDLSYHFYENLWLKK